MMYVFGRTFTYTFSGSKVLLARIKRIKQNQQEPFLMLLTQSENSQRYLHLNASFSGSCNTCFQLLRQL